MSELLDLIKSRKSVRQYTGKHIPDEDLKKIYEYERMLFVANVPGFAVEQAGYFLKDITSKGILETAAEANLIINAPVKWKNLGTRTIFLQQYFPKTIAYIANKYRTLG